MKTCLLVLLAASCVRSPPRVPDHMLSDVSPEVVATVEPMRAQLADLDRDVAVSELDLGRAITVEERLAERLEALDRAVEGDLELKRLAVERGDALAASQADQRIADNARTQDQARAQLEAATSDRQVEEAELDLLRADRDLLAARIELERARAVADTQELKLGRYERAVKEALARRDDAELALRRARGTTPGA